MFHMLYRYEVVVDEKVVRIYAQLTKEGLKTYFDQKGYTDPVYVNTDTMQPSELSFLTVSTEALNCPAKDFHNQLLRKIKIRYEISDDKFNQFDIANISSSTNRPRALYTSTGQNLFNYLFIRLLICCCICMYNLKLYPNNTHLSCTF